MSNQDDKRFERKRVPFYIEALAWLFIHIPYYAVFYFSVRILTHLIKTYLMP
jgi:hypothetical protein